jgi:hypothetical protein
LCPGNDPLNKGRFQLFNSFWSQIQAAAVEVYGVNEILLVPEAAGRDFTHWIFALIDSLLALAMRCRRYVMMFSNRRLSIRATAIGCSRHLTAQLCREKDKKARRRCFLCVSAVSDVCGFFWDRG